MARSTYGHWYHERRKRDAFAIANELAQDRNEPVYIYTAHEPGRTRNEYIIVVQSDDNSINQTPAYTVQP
jgi:hypothetical protein